VAWFWIQPKILANSWSRLCVRHRIFLRERKLSEQREQVTEAQRKNVAYLKKELIMNKIDETKLDETKLAGKPVNSHPRFLILFFRFFLFLDCCSTGTTCGSTVWFTGAAVDKNLPNRRVVIGRESNTRRSARARFA